MNTRPHGFLALAAALAATAGAACQPDPCHPNDRPSAAPTLDPSTLAEARARFSAQVHVDSSSGLVVTLTPSVASSCPVLSATATLNGEPMAIADLQRMPRLVPGSCDGDTQCCTSSYYTCGDLEFSAPSLPAGPLDIVVSDASGSQRIAVLLSGAFPSFSIRGSNVLAPGETISLSVSPPDAVAQQAYVSSSNGIVFSGLDLTQDGSGISFVVPPLDEVFDPSAPPADCTDPSVGAMTVPCNAGLTVQFETPFPTATVTKCDFGSCSADVDPNIGFTPVTISGPNVDANDAGADAADGA